ncbi:hypothetical protein CFAEC_01310 [Corynebacterium faecale]|uniref:hypothetical protein n=1 Tax=Corynebacterium faecale TaxID=1758466 RepID=UPI0025B608FE|nr:hypothetical protein [Corynebacterium faecale]WJY91122.1 hypothetical protein CFAEC_01310 [Corynebacterium faecale]
MSTNLNPQDAQQLLNRASRLQHSATGFSISWVGFVGICAGSALYAISAATWAAAGFPHALLLITALTWILCCTLFSIIVAFRSGSAPRGFAIRWATMMGLWTLLWVIATFFGPEFTALQAAGMSIVFLTLALAGPTWELISIGRSTQ